jgi:RHS repeat-associated protein
MMPSGAATNLFYIDSDHLNTPRTITSQAKQKRWEWNSDPFGTTLANENPAALGVFTFNLRFVGQYFDKETGLHYNYFRDYNPSIGRYIQSDPIGLAGGLNTYAYVGENPVSFTDPRGEMALPVAVGVGVGVLTSAYLATPAGQEALSNLWDTAEHYFDPGLANDPNVYADNNKATRKKITGLENQLREHEKKLQADPNCDAACHWEKEIKAWKERIERLKKRLPGCN